MKKTLLGFVIILFSIISCKKASEKSTDAQSVSPQPSQSQEYVYTIDTEQSIINWSGYKIQKSLNLNHFGTIRFKEGDITFDRILKNGTFIADMSTLTDDDLEDSSLNKKLTEHLKSKDFLDTTAYPTATFTINSVTPVEKNSDYNTELNGSLTFKDISKDITLKANTRTNKNTLFLNTERFSISRKDFNIIYKGPGDAIISDNFDIQISIIAQIKKK